MKQFQARCNLAIQNPKSTYKNQKVKSLVTLVQLIHLFVFQVRLQTTRLAEG